MSAQIINFPSERVKKHNTLSEVYISEEMAVFDFDRRLISVIGQDIMFDNYIPQIIHLVMLERGVESFHKSKHNNMYVTKEAGGTGWVLQVI